MVTIKQDPVYFKFLVVALLMLLLLFDRDFAIVYLLILVADWIWYTSDRFISFKFIRAGANKFFLFGEAVVATGLFLLVSSLLVAKTSITQNIIAGAQSIFELLATSTPVLQGSPMLTFIGWGILIPVIETSFFNGRLLEGFATYGEKIFGHKISVQKFSVPLMVVMIVIASLFTLFHLTAKFGAGPSVLIITFLFSIISSILVVRQQSLFGAVSLHVIVNSLAVGSSLGWI